MNDNNQCAGHSLADARSLLDQQEYEFQRGIADLQLVLRELEQLVENYQLNDVIASELLGLPVNLKHMLHTARHELYEAVDYARRVGTQLRSL